MSANVFTNMSNAVDLKAESDRCFTCKLDKALSNLNDLDICIGFLYYRQMYSLLMGERRHTLLGDVSVWELPNLELYVEIIRHL